VSREESFRGVLSIHEKRNPSIFSDTSSPFLFFFYAEELLQERLRLNPLPEKPNPGKFIAFFRHGNNSLCTFFSLPMDVALAPFIAFSFL